MVKIRGTNQIQDWPTDPTITDFVNANHQHNNVNAGGIMRQIQNEPKAFDYVFQYDGSYNVKTTEAKTTGSTPYVLLADNSEYVYLGLDSLAGFLGEIFLGITTPAVGATLKIERSEGGGSWYDLTPDLIFEETNNYTQAGRLLFNITGLEATDTVNGVTAYWYRLKTTSNPGTPPQGAIIAPFEYSMFIWSVAGDSVPTFGLGVRADGLLRMKGPFYDGTYTASMADIADAIAKKHSQNTDTGTSNDWTIATTKNILAAGVSNSSIGTIPNPFKRIITKHRTYLADNLRYPSVAELTRVHYDDVSSGTGALTCTTSGNNFGLKMATGGTNGGVGGIKTKTYWLDPNDDMWIHTRVFLSAITNTRYTGLAIYAADGTYFYVEAYSISGDVRTHWSYRDYAAPVESAVTMAINTWYNLDILSADDRYPKLYINGELIRTCTNRLNGAAQIKLLAGNSDDQNNEMTVDYLGVEDGGMTYLS